ncbi:hypothetical protein V8C35DRAFT_306392 [Trichoderma chlorosporum]
MDRSLVHVPLTGLFATCSSVCFSLFFRARLVFSFLVLSLYGFGRGCCWLIRSLDKSLAAPCVECDQCGLKSQSATALPLMFISIPSSLMSLGKGIRCRAFIM